MRTDLTPLENQLIRHEALRLKPYRCTAGKLTIGVGRNLDDNGISEDEAIALLRNDIAAASDLLDRDLPWNRRLDEIRREVLVNMCFNMGIGGLKKFAQTLALVARGDYEGAADAMLRSQWAKQVGPRATELSQQMRTGVRKD